MNALLPVDLNNHGDPRLRAYLTENDFRMEFSLTRKIYYRAARPVLPLRMRQWLQRRHGAGIERRADFIWPDLVELLQADQPSWTRFVESLYPAGFETAVVLTHDVEDQAGYDFIPKVIDLEQRYGFRGSWNLVPYKDVLHREITDFIVDSGHEIGIHGYNHDGTDFYSRERFLERAVHINRALDKYGAVGFRAPQVHRDLEWLQDLNIEYDASCFDYDPYQPFPGGTASIWPFRVGKFVELPYTVPQDHVLFYALGLTDISIWKRKTAWIARNRGMVLTLTHPDYLREKDHLGLYEAGPCLPQGTPTRLALFAEGNGTLGRAGRNARRSCRRSIGTQGGILRFRGAGSGVGVPLLPYSNAPISHEAPWGRAVPS